MQLVDSQEAALRTRAAIAHSGKEQGDIAELSGIPLYTIRRIVSLTNPRGATIEELWLIADACGVPHWFMEAGFDVDLAQDDDIDLAVTDDMLQFIAIVNSIDLDGAADIGELISGLKAAVVELSSAYTQQQREIQALAAAGRPKERRKGRGQG